MESKQQMEFREQLKALGFLRVKIFTPVGSEGADQIWWLDSTYAQELVKNGEAMLMEDGQ